MLATIDKQLHPTSTLTAAAAPTQKTREFGGLMAVKKQQLQNAVQQMVKCTFSTLIRFINHFTFSFQDASNVSFSQIFETTDCSYHGDCVHKLCTVLFFRFLASSAFLFVLLDLFLFGSIAHVKLSYLIVCCDEFQTYNQAINLNFILV